MRAPAAALVVLPALGACLSIPPYQPQTAVSFTGDKGGGTISGPGFALHFAGGLAFHFPDALTVGNTNVLGSDVGTITPPACHEQSGTGFLIFPTSRISADGNAKIVNNTLAAKLTGPAVVQVALDWTTQFSCSPERTPGGTSTFTVFPDGRIIRHDTLDDPKADPDHSPQASACNCVPGNTNVAFTTSSYWALSRAAFGRIESPKSPLPFPVPGENITNFSTVCLDADGFQMVSALLPDLAVGETTQIHGGQTLIGHDLLRPIGVTRLDPFHWDAYSALLIGKATSCTAMYKRATEYTAPSTLMINDINDKPVMPSAADGMYHVELSTGHAVLTGTVNAPFAVRLKLPHASEAVRARLPGATGEWYVPQAVSGTDWIVWFRDPLASGSIAIDAE